VYLGADPKHALHFERIRDAHSVYIGIKVSDDDELSPRLQIGTVPFAAQADSCTEAETLEGMPASEFALAKHKHAAMDIADGPGSGLDADTLDGKHAESLASAIGYFDVVESTLPSPVLLSASPIVVASKIVVNVPSRGHVVINASAVISLNATVAAAGTACSISESPTLQAAARLTPVFAQTAAPQVPFAITAGYELEKGDKTFYLLCSRANDLYIIVTGMTAIFSANKL
jgi:hypothetical protein